MQPVKNKIVIYTTSWCPYCVKAKELLKKKGVAFEEYDIEEEPGAREAMQLLSGSKTVPQVYLGNTLLGGCDELHALDDRGDLDCLPRHRLQGGGGDSGGRLGSGQHRPGRAGGGFRKTRGRGRTRKNLNRRVALARKIRRFFGRPGIQ